MKLSMMARKEKRILYDTWHICLINQLNFIQKQRKIKLHKQIQVDTRHPLCPMEESWPPPKSI